MRVLIIGAGPAGCCAAYTLAKLGIKALLIERNPKGHKPCGGGLTKKSLMIFRLLGLDVTSLIRSTCDLVFIATYAGTYALMGSPIHVVKREELDEFLLSKALEEGVELVKGNVVRVIERRDGVVVECDSGVLEGDFVIGADGALSITAKSLGVKGVKRGIAIMSYARGNARTSRYVCLLDFTRARYGYAWLFPLGDGLYNIGIGSWRWGDYRERLLDFAKGLGLKAGEVKGRPLPIRPINWATSRRVLLVGDARGLVDPITGEGIPYAALSGVLAALSIALNSPCLYERLLRPIIVDLNIAYRLAPVIYDLDAQALARIGFTAFSLKGARELAVRASNGEISHVQAFKEVLKKSIYVLVKAFLRAF